MKPKRLWPVATAMFLLLLGTFLVELLAESRGANTEIIHISSSRVENSEDVDELNWKFVEPLDAMHGQARQFALRKQYDKSILIFETLVKSNPENKNLLAEYGHWLRRAKRDDRAMEVLEKLISSGTDSTSAYLDIAILYRKKGQTVEADSAFKKAVENRPNHAPTRIAYAKLLRDLKRYDEAIVMLKSASRYGGNEERARALATLGRYYMETDQKIKARKVLNEAIERAPAMGSIWTRVARAFMKSDAPQDQQSAIEHAVKAARLAPNESYVHALLGRAHEKVGQQDAAEAAYENALRLDHGDFDSKEKLARIYLEKENFDDARKYAQELLKTDKTNRPYLFLLGKIEYRSGRFPSALENFDAIILAYPASAEAWYNRGLVLRKTKRLDEGVQAYKKAITLKENYSAAWNNLGLIYQQKKEFALAEMAFKEAISKRAGYQSARRNLARLFYTQKKYPQAIVEYEKILKDNPEDQKTRMNLAINLRKSGDSKSAISQYQKIVKRDPRLISAWYNLGVAFNHEKDLKNAEKAYRKALILDPNHRKSIKNIGYLKSKTGDLENAIVFFKDALDREPDDAPLRADLADLYFSKNNLKECMTEAERAIGQAKEQKQKMAYEKILEKCQIQPETP